MEFPFSVLSVGLELLTIIFCILLFFRGRLRVNGVRSFFILVLLFFVTTGSYFLLRPLFGGGDSFKTLYSIYCLAVIILFLSWLFRESIFVTIFMVFAARNYLDGTNMISDLVSVIWHSASFSGSQTATVFLCRLTVYILLVPVLYHFFKVCIHPAIASTKSMNIWNYLWIIPVSFFFLYRLGFNPYYTAIETGNKNSMLLFPLVWYPGMFFCQLCIFRLLSETSQNIVLREKLHTAELLTEMEKEYEGFSKAVKFVCRAQSGLQGIHGPVANLVKTDGRYSLAIEIALGAGLQNIVVDREEDAKAAISYLKQRDAGRATFLPLTAIRGDELHEKGVEKEFGFVGLGSRLVTFDPAYRNIVYNLLGRTVVVEDLDCGIAMARKYRNAFRIVTLDGQVINRGGSMTGGSTSRSAGVLSRSAELEQLTARTAASSNEPCAAYFFILNFQFSI